MDKIYVVYWSQTGNTESMANAIAEGIKEAGKEAAVVTPSEINADELNAASVYALGSPAMGAEVIEEDEMEPLVSALEGNVSGKKIALFGSYGWGDGEWMRSWVERMTSAGATVVGGEDAKALCKKYEHCQTVYRRVFNKVGNIAQMIVSA